jgi:predicted aldo/keto reductase-like oxidoreductase
MRYLMYCRSYGERDYAAAEYKKIPQKTRERIATADYSSAEKKCPQKIAIAKLMQQAADELS